MAIQPQLIPVTLKGISQKSPPNTSMPGEMVSATNVQVLKGSARGVEFSKRYGTQSLPAATNSASSAVNPRHMVTLGNSLVLDNDQAVFARDLSQNAWITYPRNGLNFTSQTTVVSESLYQKVSPAYAYDANSGNEIIAWYDQAAGVRFSVRGRTLGDWSAHETPNTAAASFVATYKVQVFAPGDGYFYIVAPGFNITSLAITKLNVFNPTTATAPNFFLSFDAFNSQWDAQLTPEGNILIACKNFSTTTTQVFFWSPATATITASTTIGTTTLGSAMWLSQSPFAVGASRKYILATRDAISGILTWTFGPALAFLGVVVNVASPAPGLTTNMTGWVDNIGTAHVIYDSHSTGFFFLYSLGAVILRKVCLASKAFWVDRSATDPPNTKGTWCALARFDSVVQPALFLIDLQNISVIGKVDIAGSQWVNYLATVGTIPWVTTIGTKLIAPVMAAHTALNQTVGIPIGTQIQGVSLATFDASGPASKPVELGGVLNFPGSIPWIFDGANSVESGFNVYPEAVQIQDAGSGSSKTVAATYAYRATYVWRDAIGNVYESAPSPTVLYVPSNNHDLNINVPSLTLTNRTDVMVNVYRDDPTQPSVFRLVNSAPVANTAGTDTSTVLDSLVDLTVSADWATRALLYAGDGSNGQPVEHLPPPSHTISFTAQNRNFLAGIDQDPSAVWFSNEVVPGEGISYFDGFLFRVVGTVRAGAGRDRNVVVFTDDSIWTVTGEFPDNAFGSFAIPTPFKLPHQVGAIDSNSIVVSTIGIFFQSVKGLHILGWDWSVTYIGGNIEDTLTTDPIVSGVEVPGLHQVRLYTARGNTFVWDTVFNLWTSFSGQPALAACNWRGVPCYVGADAIVHQETPGIYGDDGSFVQSMLTFALISPNGLRGYFCLFALQLLGEIRGPHTLNASLAYNSQDFATTTYQSAAAGQDIYGDVTYGVGTYGGSGDNVLKLEIRPKKRQSASYQLSIWDSLLSSGASQGFTLESITASIGVESGLARTQGSQRMTKL